MKVLLIFLALGIVCESFRVRSMSRKSHKYFSTKVEEDEEEEDIFIESDTFWKDKGVKFGCTGCGLCCANDGEVWFDTEEFNNLANHLKLPPEDVLSFYAAEVQSGWVKLKDKEKANPNDLEQCIFLDQDGKKCTIYEARPLQCSTYPWWPRLIVNEQEWEKEAVVPMEVQGGKHWTAEAGGCEGINGMIVITCPILTSLLIILIHTEFSQPLMPLLYPP